MSTDRTPASVSGSLRSTPGSPEDLERHRDEVEAHQHHERVLMWKDVIAIVVVTAIVVVRQRWLI